MWYSLVWCDNMAKKIACEDEGMDCAFEIVSEDEAEMVDFVQIHARSVHDMSPSESDVRDMIHEA